MLSEGGKNYLSDKSILIARVTGVSLAVLAIFFLYASDNNHEAENFRRLFVIADAGQPTLTPGITLGVILTQFCLGKTCIVCWRVDSLRS